MSSLKNPLERLGVPQWFVELQLPRGQEGLEAIRRQAFVGYRGLIKLFHPEGVTPDVDRAGELSQLEESLKDLAVVEVWANYMTDSGSLYADRARAEAQKAEAHNRDRLHALLAMLPAVSPQLVVGTDTPREYILGMPDVLDRGEMNVYDQTFLLRLEETGRSRLWLLPHPNSHRSISLFTTSYIPKYDGTAWCVDYITEVDDEPVEVHHRHTEFVAQGEVCLVGGVPAMALYRMGAYATAPVDSEVLSITGGGSVQTRGLVWRSADRAWWVPGMQPHLGTGDFAVVARSAGDQVHLALAGQLISSRSL